MNISFGAKQDAGFQRAWRMAAIALVAVRFVQGWIYWGGGSRRFFYAPSKLDPHAPHWMAYKFQTAMPGALLGTGHIVSWLLHHFLWLYAGVIVFSAVELLAGAMLIAGALTRLAAACTIGLSLVLMLLFGWQGATCIDEWTMAACNFAMGVTLLLAGSGAWSIDAHLAARPRLAEARWFQWLGGAGPLPLGERTFGKLSAGLLAASVIFIVGTYSYYRGSVVTPFHGGPVSPTAHHWALSEGKLTSQGTVTFKAYVDAGTPEAPSDVVRATLLSDRGTVARSWSAESLARLPPDAIHNDYDYQRIHTGPFGLVGPIGSMATLTLPADSSRSRLTAGRYRLRLTSVNGRAWILPLTLP